MEQEYCDESDHEVPVYYDERVLGYCGEMGQMGDEGHGSLVSESEFHDSRNLLAMEYPFQHVVLVQDELESESYYGISKRVRDGPESEWYYGISIQVLGGLENASYYGVSMQVLGGLEHVSYYGISIHVLGGPVSESYYEI